MKTNTINVRIEPATKEEVEIILKNLGLTISDAINIYFSQIRLNKGLPFEVKIPNKKTLKAMAETLEVCEEGKSYKSVSELRKSLSE